MKYWTSINILLFLLSIFLSEKKKIIYLCHCETNFYTEPVQRVSGGIYVPLNDVGITHCKEVEDFLANKKIG